MHVPSSAMVLVGTTVAELVREVMVVKVHTSLGCPSFMRVILKTCGTAAAIHSTVRVLVVCTNEPRVFVRAFLGTTLGTSGRPHYDYDRRPCVGPSKQLEGVSMKMPRRDRVSPRVAMIFGIAQFGQFA